MCEAKKTWRDLAQELHEDGLSVNEICSKVYEEFSKNFRAKDSSARTVKRFLRETYGAESVVPPPKTFEEQVSDRREKIITSEAAKKDKKLLTKIAVTDMINGNIDYVIVDNGPAKAVTATVNGN